MSKCYAVQHSDQMVCERCYQSWDVNDVCEPECDPAVCIDMSEEGGMKIKEWDGKGGVPPIGAVCEYYWTGGEEWRKCEVVAHYHGSVVAVDVLDKTAARLPTGLFRPIKTPEQIAAEERLDAIEDMKDLIRGWGVEDRMLAVLYDAGYRKTEVKK